MTSVAIACSEPPADSGPGENAAGLDETPHAESPFTVFVDEIDAWARQALAANGFGDPL